MMSTTPIAQIFSMVLIVFSISFIGYQSAEGFSVSAKPMIFELQTGETGTYKWTVTNMDDEVIYVELYAAGPGSELMIFDQYLTIQPHLSIHPEIFVVVPDDHKNNIEYHPELFALKRAGPPPAEGEALSASISINVQMKSLPIIKIGDNPVYTAPKVEVKAEIPPPPKVKDIQPEIETPKELTATEKIARIQEANKERTVDDVFEETFEESFEEEAVADYEPEPYSAEITITDTTIVEKSVEECDFFAWLMSLFGMAKC